MTTFRIHKRIISTRQPASQQRYCHGRIEYLRPVTMEMKKLIESIETISSRDENDDKSIVSGSISHYKLNELHSMVYDCNQSHRQLIKDVNLGNYSNIILCN